MKYQVGEKMFYENKRTKEFSEVEIIGVKYVFNKRIGQTDQLSEEMVDEYMKTGKLSRTKEDYVKRRVQELEKELGIKLERK